MSETIMYWTASAKVARGNRAALLPILTVLVLTFAGFGEPQARSGHDSRMSLVETGEQIFMNETFGGNGRTRATCHRPTDNFGLTPEFIASLPDDDPLFVAEVEPGLAENFENPLLKRSRSPTPMPTTRSGSRAVHGQTQPARGIRPEGNEGARARVASFRAETQATEE